MVNDSYMKEGMRIGVEAICVEVEQQISLHLRLRHGAMRGDPSSSPARAVAGGGDGDGEPHTGDPTVVRHMKSSAAHRCFDLPCCY